MLKSILEKIWGVLAFFILLFIFAKWGPTINFSTSSQVKGTPFVTTGEGKVFVTPDIAKVTIGVQENGNSLKTVQDNVSQKSKALTDAMEKLGIDKKDIRTVSYQLYPQYDYSTSNSQRIIGYQVSINYQVTVRNFDKVNEVVTIATSVGANVVGGVSFEVNDATQKEKLQEARELAVSEAKSKAEGLAKAAGITLGKIVNISENQSSGGPQPFYGMGGATRELAKESAAPANIQPGQTEISVIVSLSYEVR